MRIYSLVFCAICALFLSTNVIAQEFVGVLSAPQALDMQKAGTVRIIDIRTLREWQDTGVPVGAWTITLRSEEEFVAAIGDAVKGDKSAKIALICRTGNRSGRAVQFLRTRGYTSVYDVAEGMVGSQAGPGWIARQLPVEDR